MTPGKIERFRAVADDWLNEAQRAELSPRKAGTLRPITPAQQVVTAQALPLERGRIINSIEGTMDESEDSSKLSALQNAVQEGLADSEAGKYTVVNSADALAAHLKSLRAYQKQKR